MRFLAAIAAVLLTFSATAVAKPGFGALYYDGNVVGTVVPPAATPLEGIDPIYAVMGGVEGQLPVAGVGPGDKDYHGGKWAFYAVTWNMDAEPYLLTSGEEVLEAYMDGDLNLTRVIEMDFKCPIQRKVK